MLPLSVLITVHLCFLSFLDHSRKGVLAHRLTFVTGLRSEGEFKTSDISNGKGPLNKS